SDDRPAVARRAWDRPDVPAGRGEPGRLLPSLAGFGAAPGGDRAQGRDPEAGAPAPALRLSPDRGLAEPCRLVGQSQAGAAPDAGGQPPVPPADIRLPSDRRGGGPPSGP